MNSYDIANDLKNIEINKKKLEMMKLKIIGEERNNVKTKAKTRDEMVEKLKSIIIEEVKKKY